MNNLSIGSVVVAATLLLSPTVQTTPAYAETLSAEQMIEKLTPKPRTRSIRAPSGDVRGIKVEGRRTEDASLNLYINFEYDSSDLGQDARIVLDQLATALSDGRLDKFDFLIAGHTDAAGSDAYNQTLSERRAQSVKSYLMAQHQVSGQRLIERGYGESRLLDPDNPTDGSNRRVQIITLSIPAQ